MSNTSGPVSTLPGHVSMPPFNTPCDGFNKDCPNIADIRIQGETDSFSAEYINACNSCAKEMRKDKLHSDCDWCGKLEYLAPIRDHDEGLCGPVYQCCQNCRLEYYSQENVL